MLEAVDTLCINTTITGNGTPANPYLISAAPIIDPAAGNQLSCGAAGLLVPAAAAVAAGHIIEDEGAALAQRATLNFVGDSVIATDDAGNNETDVTINHPATAIHSVAQPLTVRKNTGADVGTRPRINLIEGTNITLTVVDDAGSNEVDITIDAAGGGAAMARAEVSRSTTQSIANVTWTLLSFDTEEEDTDTLWAPGTPDRFVVVTAGVYLVEARTSYTFNTSGALRLLTLNKSATPDTARLVIWGPKTHDGTDNHMFAVATVRCVVGDVLTAQTLQNSGGNLNLLAGAKFIASRLGA